MSNEQGLPDLVRSDGQRIAPRHPIDVFGMIMSCMPTKRDVHSLMSTCFHVYNAGVPQLFKFPYRIQRSNLRSFCDFCDSKAPSSYSSLRELTFHCHDFDQAEHEILSRLLKHAENLRHLDFSTGNAFRANPTMLASVFSLKQLEQLSCYDGLDSMLAALHATFRRQDSQRPPTSSLSGRSTIQPDANASRVDDKLCLPKVVALEGTTSFKLSLSTLMTAFPSLKALYLNTSGEYHNYEDVPLIFMLDTLQRYRRRNIKFQEERHGWKPPLTYLHADSASLYALGLQCQVQAVNLDGRDLIAPDDVVPLWQDAFAALRPEYIRFRDCDPSNSFKFIQRGVQECQRLDLLCIDLGDIDEEFDEMLDHLFGALASLEFDRLRMFTCELMDVSSGGGALSDDIEDFLWEIDLEDLAHRAIAAMPSLQYIHFDIWGRWARYAYWEVQRPDRDTVHLKRVPRSMHAQLANASLYIDQRSAYPVREPAATLDPSIKMLYRTFNLLASCIRRNTKTEVPPHKYKAPADDTETMDTSCGHEISGDSSRSNGSLGALNDDVLLAIFQLLGDRQLLSIMRACRVLFQLGLPVLLGRSQSFKLWKNESIERFHRFYSFLRSTSPSSFSSLRSLSVWGIDELPESELRILADVLGQAKNLRSLDISCRDIALPVPVSRTLAALANLKHLSFDPCSADEAHTILGHLSDAPLVSLTIEFSKPFVNPIPPLYPFQHTLEELRLTNVALDAAEFPLPKVTRLYVDNCGPARLSALIATFPNLEVLTMYSSRKGLSDDSTANRDENISYQEFERRCWQSLTSLTADKITLYALGLEYQVDSVVVPSRSPPFHSSELVPLRPRHLQLYLSDSSYHLRDILVDGMDRLERLDIVTELDDAVDSAVARIGDMMDMIIAALESVQLRMLYCIFTNINEGWDYDYNYEDTEFVHLIADKLQMENIASRAMMAVPSLQYLKMELKCGERRNVTYWMVSGNGGSRQMKKLVPLRDWAVTSIDQMFLPAQIQINNAHPRLAGSSRVIKIWTKMSSLGDIWTSCRRVRAKACGARSEFQYSDAFGERRVAQSLGDLDSRLHLPSSASQRPRRTGEAIRFLTTLDDDVLLFILHLLKDKSLLSAMCTCRALFGLGLPVLLARDHELDLGGGYSNKSLQLCNFLRIAAPASFLLLRSLSISGSDEASEYELRMVAHVIRKAKNLRIFVIGVDGMMNIEPLAQALVSLRNLQHLAIDGEGLDMACMVLRSLQAPLISLDVNFGSGSTNPIPLLYNFRHTLERLCLSFIDLYDAPKFSCLKVTRLSIHYGSPALLSVLATAFPNLEVLNIRTGRGEVLIGAAMGQDTTRDENMAFQREKQCWRSLVSLTADPTCLGWVPHWPLFVHDIFNSILKETSRAFSMCYP
ncbi:hypothetical protein NM688_g7424 [Phlebia brevispora]|uniref:Uncharacterized protein n=1 Tax=Phlebia brevispora TaxID=194682 RepID=A0ACC1S5B8_9APHY|nr:hypothetical protein NM688_g7424 [Phlebia brevispora]